MCYDLLHCPFDLLTTAGGCGCNSDDCTSSFHSKGCAHARILCRLPYRSALSESTTLTALFPPKIFGTTARTMPTSLARAQSGWLRSTMLQSPFSCTGPHIKCTHPCKRVPSSCRPTQWMTKNCANPPLQDAASVAGTRHAAAKACVTATVD